MSRFFADEEFVLAILDSLETVNAVCKLFKWISTNLSTNRAILLAAAEKTSWILRYAPVEHHAEICRVVNEQQKRRQGYHRRPLHQCVRKTSVTLGKGRLDMCTRAWPPEINDEPLIQFKALQEADLVKSCCRQQRRAQHMEFKITRPNGLRKKRTLPRCHLRNELQAYALEFSTTDSMFCCK